MTDAPDLTGLLGLQRPSGAFPSTVADRETSAEDETCFVTASVALLLGGAVDGGSARARSARERALDFVERCEVAEAPGAFAFYPSSGSTPRIVESLPADADDTSLAWLALLAAGRRTVAEARCAFVARIGPSSRQLVPGDAPPWVRRGAVRTWLVERGRDNPVDLVVNANVAALAARIGETSHTAYVGACATLLAAAAGDYDPTAFARRLAPFYASISELEPAVSRAHALGASTLGPCRKWVAKAGRGDDPLKDDQPLYCNQHGSPVWRAPALQRARRLADRGGRRATEAPIPGRTR